MMRPPLPALLLALALASGPALAEGPNLSGSPQRDAAGAAHRLVLAQAAWDRGFATGDTLMLLSAVRLARSVVLRPAAGWELTAADPVEGAPQGRAAADDPASDAALAILRNLAGDDPDLQDLVFDLDAQLPHGPPLTAVQAASSLAPGQTESWRLALSGEVAAELAALGDGDGPLALTLTDESGAVLCATPPSLAPALCRITPARNGFFILAIRNDGPAVNSYRLIGN